VPEKDTPSRRNRGAALEQAERDTPPQPGSDDRPQPDSEYSLGHHPKRESPEEA